MSIRMRKKNTIQFDESSDSDSNEDEFNHRQHDNMQKQLSKDIASNVRDFKRARHQDMNFKSLSREETSSPNPCVTYRGSYNSKLR